MHTQIFILAILLLVISISTSFAVTNDEAVSAVTDCYRITKPGLLGGFSEIGSILRAKREGLRVSRPSNVFKPNIVKDHQLIAAGGGALSISGIHEGTLKSSERLYLYGVHAGNNNVQLDLYTVDSYLVPGSGTRSPTPLQASIRYQFDSGLEGMTARQLMDTIGEWLVSEGNQCPKASESRPPVEFRSVSVNEELHSAERAILTVKIGQTIEDVASILGSPEKRILLGEKIIFVYRDVKIIFINGKVSDAE